MDKDSKVFVAGHRGMVGSAVVRKLTSAGYTNILTKHRSDLDLTDTSQVNSFFHEEKPEYVILAAAKVGGILANRDYKADFIRENLQIQLNVIDSSFRSGVDKLLFLGSSCIYPRDSDQPIKEDYLLTGPLESTNDAYAIAKIAGLKTCEAYWQQHGFKSICLMPTNLYGPYDNFDLASSHVFAALIRKFHQAKIKNAAWVDCWGDGSPYREFLHVDDLAAACIYFMQSDTTAGLINIGTGDDITIKNLANTIAKVVGFKGEIRWDTSKPNGTPRKLLDVSRANDLGWSASIELKAGVEQTYDWFLSNSEFVT